jgi:hypothetical protein
MSSPHVAGAAALLLEADPWMPAMWVRDAFQNSADPKFWSLAPGYGLLDHVYRQGAGMVDIDDTLLAETLITPGKLSVGEGEAGPKKFTLIVQNFGSKRVTYDLSWESAIAASGVIDIDGFWLTDENVTFKRDHVSVRPNRFAKVRVTITPPTGPEFGMYSGYIVFTPRDGGQVYRVPYAGYVGDYQGIQSLTDMGYDFPWLAYLDNFGFYNRIVDDGRVFTLEGGDVPYVLLHLDHQVEELNFEIYDADTGLPIDGAVNRALSLNYVGRNSTTTSFFAFPWDGTAVNGQLPEWYDDPPTVVPDGNYYLVVKALKAGGNPWNAAHWETWTTPTMVIDRP